MDDATKKQVHGMNKTTQMTITMDKTTPTLLPITMTKMNR
jgi:hypothetical protein